MRIIVLAKAPVAGRSKTRLQSRWSPHQAAALAEASLTDTLETVARVPGVSRELVLEGEVGDWLPAGFDVRAQAAGDLGERIYAALVACAEPTLLIGMDTPQVTAAQLLSALRCLDDHDAALGLASDGGWWALGFAEPAAHAHRVKGVPTSLPTTGQQQRVRLAGLLVADLDVLRDVDLPEDADAVAELAPHGRFAELVRRAA